MKPIQSTLNLLVDHDSLSLRLLVFELETWPGLVHLLIVKALRLAHAVLHEA